MFSFGKNDTLPYIETLVSNSAGYIDLSNSTGALFVYQPKSRNINAISGLASILGPTSGHIRYQLSGVSGGFYYGQFFVYFSGNNRVSFPNDGYSLFGVNLSL